MSLLNFDQPLNNPWGLGKELKVTCKEQTFLAASRTSIENHDKCLKTAGLN